MSVLHYILCFTLGKTYLRVSRIPGTNVVIRLAPVDILAGGRHFSSSLLTKTCLPLHANFILMVAFVMFLFVIIVLLIVNFSSPSLFCWFNQIKFCEMKLKKKKFKFCTYLKFMNIYVRNFITRSIVDKVIFRKIQFKNDSLTACRNFTRTARLNTNERHNISSTMDFKLHTQCMKY